MSGIKISWDVHNTQCSIITEWGVAALAWYKFGNYQITEFRINSNMLHMGKGKELMEIIVQEAKNKGAKCLYVVPDYEECYDGKDLREIISDVNPQQYVEERYISYGFKKLSPCNDGSSHSLFIKDLEERK